MKKFVGIDVITCEFPKVSKTALYKCDRLLKLLGIILTLGPKNSEMQKNWMNQHALIFLITYCEQCNDFFF